MEKIKEILKDNTFVRSSIFIVFNALLLYVLYFMIKNTGSISSTIVSGFHILTDAFWPLIIGLVLAYLLNPLSTFIDEKILDNIVSLPSDHKKAEKRRNIRHLISVILTYLVVIAAVIAIIYGFAVMIIGKVVFTDMASLVDDLVGGIIKYESAFRGWVASNLPEGLLSDKIAEMTTAVMAWLSENFSATSVIAFFTNIGGNIVDLVIGIIISIYLMKDKNLFLRMWRNFLTLILPEKKHHAITETLGEVNGVLSKFIRGALLDAMFVAILSSIGLSILGLQAAVFIGVFAGICNVIPYFGPVLGMIPAFLMGTATGGLWHGILAVVILFAVQQIDCNLIYPKVVGTSTGLHPLAVLLSVSVFGYFGGILGMLLAVPIAGILQIFVKKFIEYRKKKLAAKGIELETAGTGCACEKNDEEKE